MQGLDSRNSAVRMDYLIFSLNMICAWQMVWKPGMAPYEGCAQLLEWIKDQSFANSDEH